MRNMLMVGILLLTGCQNITGPFKPRAPERVDDPRFSIREQEARGRDRYAIPDESTLIAPRSGNARPGMSADR